MKLFAVLYLKGHLAAAMFLWPGATLQDCEKINAQYSEYLPTSKGIKSGAIKISDVRLDCEWHADNPLKN